VTLLDAIGSVGAVLLVAIAGIWLERKTGSPTVYRSLPGWAKLVVAALAFGLPWIPFWRGAYPPLPPDPLLWAFALSAVLWITTPLLLARLVETRPSAEAGC